MYKKDVGLGSSILTKSEFAILAFFLVVAIGQILPLFERQI